MQKPKQKPRDPDLLPLIGMELKYELLLFSGGNGHSEFPYL